MECHIHAGWQLVCARKIKRRSILLLKIRRSSQKAADTAEQVVFPLVNLAAEHGFDRKLEYASPATKIHSSVLSSLFYLERMLLS